MATYTIVRKLDLLKHNGTAGGIPPVVLRRGDSGTEIQAEVTYGGAKFDLTGYSAMFCAVNADGGVIRREAVVDDADDGIVTYDATTDLTSVAGPVLVAYFELTSEDDEVATTDTLPFIILPNADLDGEAAQEYQVLIDELVAQAQEALGDMSTALDDAEAATAAANAAAAMASQYVDIGAAETLIGNDGANVSFIRRISEAPRDGAARIDVIKGNTLKWNQLIKTRETSKSGTANGITVSRAANKHTFNLSGTWGGSTAGDKNIYGLFGYFQLVKTHKYYVRCTSAYCAPYFYASGFNTGNNRQPGDYIFTYTKDTQCEATILLYNFADSYTANEDFEFCLFDLTQMFGAGNEPSTVAEFEAQYPEDYYAYDAGSLQSVNIEGVKTVGFNQWDEEWESGSYDGNGTKTVSANYIRSKNLIGAFPSTAYSITKPAGKAIYVVEYGASGAFIQRTELSTAAASVTFTTTASTRSVAFCVGGAGSPSTVYNHDICLNISNPALNGTYRPYVEHTREIPASTYFPQGLRSAGTARDALYRDHAETVIGAVDLGTLTWVVATSGDLTYYTTNELTGAKAPSNNSTVANIQSARFTSLSRNAFLTDTGENIAYNVANILMVHTATQYESATAFKTAMSGVMLHYELATPTTQTIDPPLNLTYPVEAGGTEAVLYDDTANAPQTAPPEMVIYYGYTAEGVRDEALSVVAAVENHKASTNYAVGSYLIHDGTLYKVTSAIASGEAITPGTNVTATTVMAELIALTS